MNKAQRELAAKHGTPAEFRDALDKAILYDGVTADEARAALDKYQAEWDDAGKKKRAI